jgi:PleD family two-component response regulator
MLAVVADSDARFAAAVMHALGERNVATVLVHDYETATRLLANGPLPSVLYVGAAVRPLTGADLLAELERNQRLAGIPTVAAVSRADSLLAIALRRGGVHTLAGADATSAAALIANIAACAAAALLRRLEKRRRMRRLLRHRAGAAVRGASGRCARDASSPPSSRR